MDGSIPEGAAPDVPTPRAGYQGQPGSFGARAAARCRPARRLTRRSTASCARSSRARSTCAVLPAANRAAPARSSSRSRRSRASSRRAAEPARRSPRGDRGPGPPRPRGAARRRGGGRSGRSTRSRPRSGSARASCARRDAVPVETHDTAFAARRVAELGRAARGRLLGGGRARGGARVLEEDVSDVKPNATRFWVVARRSDAEPSVRALFFYAGAASPRRSHEAGAEILDACRAGPARPPRGFATVPEAASRQIVGAVGPGGRGARLAGSRARLRAAAATEGDRRASRRRGSRRSSRSVPFSVGGGRRAVIAGPCAVESPEQVMRLAKAVARAGATALRGGVFKPRTSPYAFQGHGLTALAWLREAGDAVGLPIVTEVMAPVAGRAGRERRGRPPDRRAQLPELRPPEGGGRGRAARHAEARLRDDGGGVALGGGVPPRAGLPRRPPLRARHPHVREGDARHARPRRPPRGARPHAPAAPRRPLARGGAARPRARPRARGVGRGRGRPHDRGARRARVRALRRAAGAPPGRPRDAPRRVRAPARTHGLGRARAARHRRRGRRHRGARGAAPRALPARRGGQEGDGPPDPRRGARGDRARALRRGASARTRRRRPRLADALIALGLEAEGWEEDATRR